MLQWVTARDRQERYRSSVVVRAQALLEEDPAPADDPYVSPERRHRRATRHEPIHMKQKQKVNKGVGVKERE
jgi:hypothetical protein